MRRLGHVLSLSLAVLALVLVALVALVAAPARAQRPIPINITSTPPGAQVFLDAVTGQPLGPTPQRAIRVPSGNHVLWFRMDGYADTQLPVNVHRRRETFNAILNALARMNISAATDDVNGAAVRIDGQPVGNIPYQGTVQPGRHLVQVGREGYVTFNQWADLSGGQLLTLPVTLQREAPSTGSVLVAADVSGAPIFVDSQPAGATPMMIDGLTAGAHVIEIRPPDLPSHAETVTIIAGQRAVVSATLRPSAPAGGSLRVLVNVPTATVQLDGATIGTGNASQDNVTPGHHILEASAEGYQVAQQPVEITAGQTQVVSIQMTAVVAAPGRIVVNSAAAGATVTIDGTDKGPAPVVVENAAAGTHAIVVQATGFEPFRTTCTVAAGHNCEITARLEPVGTPVRIVANVQGAELYLDGTLRGPVPYEGNLPVGEHRIEVRADQYRPFVEQVLLNAAPTPRLFEVTLRGIHGGPTDEEIAQAATRQLRERIGSFTHAAGPIPADVFAVDLSVGYPFIGELRLSTGISGVDFLEGGFAIRSFGRLTEFEGRVEVGKRLVPQVGLAAEGTIGGGIGPNDEWNRGVNSFGVALRGLFSLYFGDRAAFTLWTGFEWYTEQWGYQNLPAMGSTLTPSHAPPTTSMPSPMASTWVAFGCPNQTPAPINGMTACRDEPVRWRLGGYLEFVLDTHWNLFVAIDGVLNGASQQRTIFGDFLLQSDPELYARLGLTYKFW